MIRRTFLAQGLVFFGFSRRAWAQPAHRSARYSPLKEPVRIPLEALDLPWHLSGFTAEAEAPASASAPGQRVLLSGVLFRRAAAGEQRPLSALCLTCPHEQCLVDLITNPAELIKMHGRASSDPLFECGCHSSIFDARNDGALLKGPAHRGLYRFHVEVHESLAVITAVEEQALIW